MNDYNAYFYSLVSTDTQEMHYAHKRQQFLVDQGYSFQVVDKMPYSPDLADPAKRERLDFKFAKRDAQRKLFEDILINKDLTLGEEAERELDEA